MKPLPHVLDSGVAPPVPVLHYARLGEIRKAAAFWKVPNSSKLPGPQCLKALQEATADDAVAAAVAAGLKPTERGVLAAYRRYGGTVNSTVIRLDLMARGLLEKVEKRYGHFSTYDWKHDPIRPLAERLVLFRPGVRDPFAEHFSYGYGAERTIPTYVLHPTLARHVPPAGPPEWTLSPVKAATPGEARPAAEVVLDLARVLAHVAARPVKINKSGELSTPALRALAKAVPVPEDPVFVLPDPQALYFEILRGNGVIRVQDGLAEANPRALLFTLPTALQAHFWVRGWFTTRDWSDGQGAGGGAESRSEAGESPTVARRQVLAWTLAALAHQGEEWFDLMDWLAKLAEGTGSDRSLASYSHGSYAWDPKLGKAQDIEGKQGQEYQRALWFRTQALWYANALMVTLPALGLVERGRTGGKAAAACFRLTPLGRAVFGAPEVTPPADTSARFLVVQPNFDVLVYLDEADAGAMGRLAGLLKADGTSAGPVRTFRLTRDSVYNALEGGLSPAEAVGLLRQCSRNDLPTNVVQMLGEWAGRRESMVLHTDVTLLGFPSTAARDEYIAEHGGTAYGERFALPRKKGKPALAQARGTLVSDHSDGRRGTLEADEEGRLSGRKDGDTVQQARLRRFARRTDTGWEVTGATVARAVAAGHKAPVLHRWLIQSLAEFMPPLLEHALFAWAGKGPAVQLDDAILLHVADTDLFDALLTSPLVRPLLVGTPGPNWLAVRKESVEAMRELLTRMGFDPTSGLAFGELPPPDK